MHLLLFNATICRQLPNPHFWGSVSLDLLQEFLCAFLSVRRLDFGGDVSWVITDVYDAIN